jgi:hypothetical protein
MMLQVEAVEEAKCVLELLLRRIPKARLENIWKIQEELVHRHGLERIAPLHREAFELVLAIEPSAEGLAAEPEDTEQADTVLI